MKKITLLLILIYIVFSLFGCSNHISKDNGIDSNVTQSDGIPNRGKEVTSEIWRYNSDGYWLCCKFEYNDGNCSITKYQSPGTIERQYIYNSNGDIMFDQVYNSNGMVEQAWEYEYHDNNILACKREYRKGYLKNEYLYDTNSHMVSATEYKEGTDIISYQAKYTYEYDNNGNLLKSYKDGNLEHESIFDQNGNEIFRKNYAKYRGIWSLSSQWEYNYENNKLVLSRSYNADMILTGESKYAYKGDNLVIEEHYDKEGKLTERLNYLYDDCGNLYSVTGYTEEHGEEMAYFKEYNNEGKIIKHTESSGEYLCYEYDTRGNNILKQKHRSDGSILYSYEYQYDDRNLKIEEKYFYTGVLRRWEKYEYALTGEWAIKIDMLSYGNASLSPDASKKYDNHTFFKRVTTAEYDYPYESFIKVLKNNEAILMFGE